MRVLHISGGNLYGGVETVLVTLARYHQVLPALEQEFAICFEARLSTELAATGVPVHLLGEVRTRRPLTVWGARRKLRGVLRARQIDVAVCHMPWAQAPTSHWVSGCLGLRADGIGSNFGRGSRRRTSRSAIAASRQPLS